MTDHPNHHHRCRLVLIAPHLGDTAEVSARLLDALSGGDVATLILPQADRDEASFQAYAEHLVEIAQAAGVAAVIAGDSRIAGRIGADGLHLDGNGQDIRDAVERWSGRMIVGAGGAQTRDAALELGSVGPDYVFFGRFGYDTRPEPHKRNIALGTWWAEMIEVPCIVLGGSDVQSAQAVGEAGAEFVALGGAVFGEGVDSAASVAMANALLDRVATRLAERA